MKRRKFLKTIPATALVLGNPTLLPACKSKDKAVFEPKEYNTRVSAIRGTDLQKITHDAIEAIGGMNKIVKTGETVFIKPNMVTLPWGNSANRFTNGECTKVEIIVAVAEECLKAGASKVTIGDGSQMPDFDWRYAVTLDGNTNLIKEVQRLNMIYKSQVSLVCLETETTDWIEIPTQTNLNSILIPGSVKNADRVISIAVAKTHAWAQLTLSLKNFMGIPSLQRYGRLYPDGHWDRSNGMDHGSPQALSQYFLDMVAAIKPDLAIIDFSIGIEGDGPTIDMGNVYTVDMKERLGSWLVLASTDLVAADATASRIMSHNVSNISQLNTGYEMGLGEIQQKSIELIGDKLDNLRVNWKPARLRTY